MKKITLFLVSLVFAGALWAQNVQVSGVVTDAEGQSLPGVSIVVKGTGTSAISDGNGRYTLSVPGDATLTFSFLGMKTQDVAVQGRTVINVSLENDAVALEEVVVTSYGVAKRPTVTGAAVNVSSEKISALPVSSFDKALQGNAAGVMSVANSGQPGSSQSVVIRGIGSISGGTTPLYVVDGIPISTGNYGLLTATGEVTYSDNSNVMASINPNDIETVTVLKDASATSIYGSRASNGVILITTKRGKTGKAVFDFKASTGFSTRATKHFEVMGREDYLDYMTDALVNAGYSAKTTTVGSRTVNALLAGQFPQRNVDGDFYNFDWTKEAYTDNAPTYTADLSVSGGTERTKYFVSGSYFKQDGIIKESGMERGTLRVNLDQKINNRVNIAANVLLSMSDQKTPMTTSSYYTNPVFASAFYAPVDPGVLSNGDVNMTTVTYANANFVANMRYNDIGSRTYRAMPNVVAQWEIIDGLFLKSNFGVDFISTYEDQWDDHKVKGNTAYQHGRATLATVENMVWNEATTINYVKTFADVHNFNFMVGQEARKQNYRDSYTASEDFPAGLYELSAGATPRYTMGSQYQNTLLSYFLTANYDFNNKYYVSGSVRDDISSKFAEGHQSGIFWSVGASWKISSEEFLQSQTWINSLQLRSSYGTSGNSGGIGNYAAKGLYTGGGNYNGIAGIYPYQIANSELTWEKNNNFNIGLDFSVLNSRVSGTIEWYYRYTSNLLMSAPLSSTNGFTTLTSNIGEISNRGVEVTINAIPVEYKNFRWDVNLNVSSNKNRVEKLYEGQDIISGTRIYRESEDIQSVYVRRWAGVNPADGRPMYYDKDGNISYNGAAANVEREIVGSAAPDFFGGFTNKFSFYGVEVSAMLYFSVGGLITDQTMQMFTSAGYRGFFNQHISVATDRWRRVGDQVDVPKALYGATAATYGTMSDRYAYNGSYLRLRDLTVAYNLPRSITEKIKMDNVRIFVQGTNLFTLTTFPGVDPEVGLIGDYWFGYPMARTITAGIQMKF